MDDTLHSTLASWGSFYVVTGSAAATLTGLQFVVQTLLASEDVQTVTGDDPEGGTAAFSSPTVVHLSLALIISCVLCAPWPGFASLRATLVFIAAGALAYSAIVLRRARAQRSYHPVLEDWIWHFLLPAMAYGATMVSSLLLHRGAQAPMFTIAAATLLLLCIAIHNAWDTVTYFTTSVVRRGGARGRASGPLRDTQAVARASDE